jgi:Arc/MetJ-type ribon-helix-helix transcriptional regulator
VLKEYNEMTIHLPPHIENSIQAAVHSGRFKSVDDAMTRAATLLLQELDQEQAQQSAATSGHGSIGAMHADADLLDQVTQAIMHARETRTLRLPPDA